MNLTGRPMGLLARSLVRPIGWPTLLLALLPLALIASVTRWPGFLPQFDHSDHLAALRLLWSGGPVTRFTALDSPDQRFTLGVALLWLAMIWLALREVLRLVILLARRPMRHLRSPPHWRRRAPVGLILVLIWLLLGFGWPYREARRLIAAKFPAGAARTSTKSPLVVSSFRPFAVASSYDLAVYRAALLALPTTRERWVGLKLLSERAPTSDPTLLALATRQSDEATLIAMIHLLGLRRDEQAESFFVDHLAHDPRPAVRAAAADALGILYAPAYGVPLEGNDIASLATDPPIRCPYLPRPPDEPRAIPAHSDRALRDLMLAGQTSDEREAAARALLRSPPAGFSLRYAEWGVWSVEGPNLKLARAALDAIPPFVHRVGNPIRSLSAYLQPIGLVHKPIVHLTASAPIAVDIAVRIERGRPWFAFPKPDDFCVRAELRDDPTMPLWPTTATTTMTIKAAPYELQPLDDPSPPSLTDLREGYPWILPAHRRAMYVGNPGPMNWPHPELLSVGFRWQSVIVSPQQLPWMHPPAVPGDAKFSWWSRLREVPCSWISSRGESERFLYYDGPTLLPAPLQMRLVGKTLHFDDPPSSSLVTGLYIDVIDRVASAFPVALPTKATHLTLPTPLPLNAAQAEAQLLNDLVAQGLTSDEARGLMDAWRDQFFHANGHRLLTIFGTAGFDRLCPLTIRPTPTDLVRVGILLTEFDP
jgi:hypothetical protein